MASLGGVSDETARSGVSGMQLMWAIVPEEIESSLGVVVAEIVVRYVAHHTSC